MKIANVLISDSWGDVTPEAFERGIGGREGAMIFLSREWARNGHEVTSFVNVDQGRRFAEVSEERIEPSIYVSREGYHEYVPLNLTRPILANFDYDVAIAWECPSVFDDDRINERIGLKVVEMQVAHLSTKETLAAEENCDYLAALSEWHGQFLLHSGLSFDENHVKIFPNGVDITRYPEEEFQQKLGRKIGNNPKFVYSSSPDRGLWYLLQMWPYIRKEFPEAELFVCYGVKKWTEHLKWAHVRSGEMALEINRLMTQPGVHDLDKIGQSKLSRLQMEADAWIYPLDSLQSTETGCITAVENAAAGNPIITTSCDCMEDEFGKIGTIIDLPFDAEEFSQKTIDVLRDQELIEYQREIGRDFAESRDWRLIGEKWLQFFKDPN